MHHDVKISGARILIIFYLATFLGTKGLSVLMSRKAVNQSFFMDASNHVTRVRAQPFDLYLVQTTAAEQHRGIVAIIQIISRHRLLGDGQ